MNLAFRPLRLIKISCYFHCDLFYRRSTLRMKQICLSWLELELLPVSSILNKFLLVVTLQKRWANKGFLLALCSYKHLRRYSRAVRRSDGVIHAEWIPAYEELLISWWLCRQRTIFLGMHSSSVCLQGTLTQWSSVVPLFRFLWLWFIAIYSSHKCRWDCLINLFFLVMLLD